MADLEGITVVPEPTEERLGQRQLFEYRDTREELLWALDWSQNVVVADLASVTGFSTDNVAPRAETVLAIDRQDAMHDYYRSKSVPSNVEPVTADVGHLPLIEDSLDGAFSTMTYHEYAPPR